MPNRPPYLLPPQRTHTRRSARRENEIIEAINRTNTGIASPVGEYPISFSSQSSQSLVVANAATTANITLSGAQTVDGVSLTAGMICLVKDQSAPNQSQNGLYTVASGAWVKIGKPAFVPIIGTSAGVSYMCAYILTDTNTYFGMGAFYQ